MGAQARYEAAGEDAWRLAGPLVFETVPALFAGLTPSLAGTAEARIDLSGVTRADTAGLALLLEWLRLARARGGRVRYTAWPEQVRALVRVNDLAAALGAD